MFPNSDKLLTGIYWQNHTDGIMYMGNKRAFPYSTVMTVGPQKVKSCIPIRIILHTCYMLFLVRQ